MVKRKVQSVEINGENIITSLKIIKRVCEDNMKTGGTNCPFNINNDCISECTCGITDIEPDNWKILEYKKFQALG